MRSAAARAVLLTMALAAAPAAASPVGPEAGGDQVQISPGAVVRPESGAVLSTAPVIAAIVIERRNVFDPAVKGEDWWPFRIADEIRFVTREKVVRDELLFAPGDRWDALKVIQSERNLRSSYPFRQAEIVSVPRSDGRVDTHVLTQDSWSTNPRIGFGTSGGQSNASLGLEENNLLGYGKSVSYVHSQGNGTIGPQHSDSYSYGDPRFLGTRLALGGAYTRTQDGDSESVTLSRPFYALDTSRAVSLAWSNGNGVGALVQNGADYSNYYERRRVVDAATGWRLPEDRWFVQRVEVGWYEDHADFGTSNESPGTRPGLLPLNRNISGPTIAYSWIQPRYVKETYIDRMERVEDFNLGNELRVRSGYMAQAAGSAQDEWIFNASDRQGLGLGEGRFALAAASISGRVLENRWENGLAAANASFFWKNYFRTRSRTLVAHVEAAQAHRLDLENQLVLGGSTGLRGYKNDSFTGGRSILANLEDRFFFDGEYFHLARFGGALFVETGSVVPEGDNFSTARFHSDVGAGMRVAGTRSGAGTVVRMDLAYALNGGPGGSRWVFSLKAGQSFSFFNSASQRVITSPASQL